MRLLCRELSFVDAKAHQTLDMVVLELVEWWDGGRECSKGVVNLWLVELVLPHSY